MTDRLRTSTLGNGVRVVTDEMPGARSVASSVWVAVGSRDEPAPLAGASHFLEHLFFKGSEQWSARAIAEAVDSVGGDMNAFTAREHTAFHTRLPARDWRLGIDILGDVLCAPALRPADVDAEREVILEELHAALDQPEDRVHALGLEAAFPEHALGREVLGDVESVSAIGRDDIAGFLDQHYRPDRLVVAAAGAIDHDELCLAVDEHLGVLDPAPSTPVDRCRPEPLEQALITQDRPGEQVHVVLQWEALPLGHDDRYAAHVANQIVGGGTASRLFQAVREERGLAYAVYSWMSSWSDCGLLGVYAGTSPGRSPQLVEVLDAEIDSLLADGVTDEEFRVAVGYLTGATELGLESSDARMFRLGRMVLATGDVVTIDEQLDRLRSVRIDDVQRVLRTMLRGPRVVSAVGPVDRLGLVGAAR